MGAGPQAAAHQRKVGFVMTISRPSGAELRPEHTLVLRAHDSEPGRGSEPTFEDRKGTRERRGKRRDFFVEWQLERRKVTHDRRGLR